ncbi:hypothetical protein ACO0QE_003396 [Hanseniaspora vineae]
MSLSDILSSNTTLSIIWLLSNLNNGKHKTSSLDTNFNSNYGAKVSSRVFNKREVKNISISNLLSNAELNNQVIKQLNLRYQSQIMYGLTMCYNKQVEFILSDLAKIKQQLLKEISTNQHQKLLKNLKKLRKIGKQNSEHNIGMSFTETGIFDGTREYKTIFELQKLQLEQYGMNYAYKSIFYLKNGTSSYYEANNNVTELFLKDDENIAVGNIGMFETTFEGVDYSTTMKMINDVENDDNLDTCGINNNKLLIRQSDLSKELNISGSSNAYYLFNPSKEDQQVDQDFESDNVDISNFELSGIGSSADMLESDQYMWHEGNKFSRKRRNSFDTIQSDFEIDLINLDSEPPKIGSNLNDDILFSSQKSSHDMDFDLFEKNREQNTEALVEAAELPDETDVETLEPPLSSSPSPELTKSSKKSKSSFKRVKVDEAINFSNTHLRNSSENYETNMMRIMTKNEKILHVSKMFSVNSEDLIIGRNLNVMQLLTANNLRLHTNIPNNEQNVAHSEMGRSRNFQSHTNNENKESDSGSNTDSAVETARRILPNQIANAGHQSELNVLADLDQINEELEYEEDLMEIDLNVGSSSPKLGALAGLRTNSFNLGSSSLNFSSQDSTTTKKTSGDHISHFQSIEEESNTAQFEHQNSRVGAQSSKIHDTVQANEYLINRQCMKVYQYVEEKLADSPSDNISLNDVMRNDKMNIHKLPRKKTVCSTFYALLQLATRDLISFEVVKNQSPISDQPNPKKFEASDGECVFISLSHQ